MRQTNKVAIGTVVMRNKEYPVAIRPDDDVLKLETMYFADEIRSPGKDLPDLPDADEVTDREVQMAKLLLESMESEWDPAKYHDTHREKVEALIEEKRQGHAIVTGVESAPASTKVVDLMEVLSASIDSVKATRETGQVRKDAKRAAPAKKAAAKKPTPIKKATKVSKAKTPARRKAS
jgi:DNA end-binding protein Ku